MATDSGDDAAALRDRVKQLEQTVSEQQQTIESLSSPTASRRAVLGGAAAAAGLGALGWYSSYPARAQAAGQVGAQSEPVDVFANAIDANEVSTEAVNRGIGFGTTDIPTGETEVVYDASSIQRRIQKNDNVGTTATQIINIDNLNGYNNIKAGQGVVYGSDNTDAATTFTDFLIWTRAGSVTQVASSGRGSTDARSYAIDASGIELSFAADNYEVDVDITGSPF